MYTSSDWAKEVEALEVHAEALSKALEGVIPLLETGQRMVDYEVQPLTTARVTLEGWANYKREVR